MPVDVDRLFERTLEVASEGFHDKRGHWHVPSRAINSLRGMRSEDRIADPQRGIVRWLENRMVKIAEGKRPWSLADDLYHGRPSITGLVRSPGSPTFPVNKFALSEEVWTEGKRLAEEFRVRGGCLGEIPPTGDRRRT